MYFAGGYDAYAAAYYRLNAKGCPLLGRIAHGARMEFIAGKARGSIASGPHPSNQVSKTNK